MPATRPRANRPCISKAPRPMSGQGTETAGYGGTKCDSQAVQPCPLPGLDCYGIHWNRAGQTGQCLPGKNKSHGKLGAVAHASYPSTQFTEPGGQSSWADWVTIVRTAYPQKIKKKNQKKEKMRQTSISALVRLRQAGDCECKASLSYSETLPNNKPIKRLLSEMHGQDEVSNGLFR